MSERPVPRTIPATVAAKRTMWPIAVMMSVLGCGSTEAPDEYRCTKTNPDCPAGFTCDLDIETCVRPAQCGNGTLDTGEDCDGANLDGKTCASERFDSGTLACASDCTLDVSGCTKESCGNGTIDSGEDCDGANLDGKTCASEGFDGGSLSCTPSACVFDTSGCYKCGDGTINGSEVCDGTRLGGKTCVSEGFDGGTLACAAKCAALDTAGCYKCGDGAVDQGEQCDKTNLAGRTCKTVGYDGGTLSCKSNCTFDTSSCYKCGDGIKDGSEACDGTDLGGVTCTSEGFAGGTLGCTASCMLDKSGCTTAGFASIPAGTFTMGSPASEYCRMTTEDQHQVTLTHPFEIQATEVTQGAFEALMGYNPSYFGPNGSGTNCGNQCPVEQVSWHEAAAYCNALSADRGWAQCYSCTGSGASVSCQEATAYRGKNVYDCPGYRLPTEAEWEYAYRAGTQTAFYNGPIISCTDLYIDANADKIGWYSKNANSTTHPVGQKLDNAWYLYDMAGNVMEWCHDWYQSSLGFSAATDPFGSSPASYRVLRGGSWNFGASWMRAADRRNSPPAALTYSIGFRCARTK